MCGSGSLETCGWVRTHISRALGSLLLSESRRSTFPFSALMMGPALVCLEVSSCPH